ncbi:MAG: NapC/NirT family cytochrome c [Anaerolineae bacterium]
MKRMGRSIWQDLRAFFLPGLDAFHWRRAMPYLVVTALVVAAAFLGVFTGRYTNSNGFCGTLCHDIMYPYMASYQQSTHTRVNCVECPMGRDALREQLPRKTTHAAELLALLTGSYEQPLVARRLYPARITCELCHYPPQFFDDKVWEICHYADDRENTPISTWLVIKTGGGLRREGLGYGIHWHVENRVYCHDGRHVSAEGEVVRIECNLCHSGGRAGRGPGDDRLRKRPRTLLPPEFRLAASAPPGDGRDLCAVPHRLQPRRSGRFQFLRQQRLPRHPVEIRRPECSRPGGAAGASAPHSHPCPHPGRRKANLLVCQQHFCGSLRPPRSAIRPVGQLFTVALRRLFALWPAWAPGRVGHSDP